MEQIVCENLQDEQGIGSRELWTIYLVRERGFVKTEGNQDHPHSQPLIINQENPHAKCAEKTVDPDFVGHGSYIDQCMGEREAEGKDFLKEQATLRDE